MVYHSDGRAFPNDSLDEGKVDGGIEATIYQCLQRHFIEIKTMAEAFLSREHFYINGSQFNDSDQAQNAVITVKDSNDILKDSEDWLVHITRFSCDSMISLPYIEADPTAIWEIKVFDERDIALETFNFVLEKDFATPRDLISSMNVKGRFRPPLSILQDAYECYRFIIDAGGRFRLIQPDHIATNRHITYAGSASMNKLLGFDNVTSFVRFAPSYEHQFSDAVDWLHTQALALATPANIYSGAYYTAMNKVLVHLLNGLEIKTHTLSGVEIVTNPIGGSGFLNGINVLSGYTGDRGRTPSSLGNTNEALLPRTGIPVLCEYFDHPVAGEMDRVFKRYTSKMVWTQNYIREAGAVTYTGIVTFRDLVSSGVAVPPSNFPSYIPGTADTFANSRYVYPLDSICGYYASGDVTGGQTGNTVASVWWVASRPNDLHLEQPLHARVKIGDDFWFQDKFTLGRGSTQLEPALASKGYTVHQVMAISTDRMTVTFDYPLGPILLASGSAPQFPYMDLLFTDRRVPFQTRSVAFASCVVAYEPPESGDLVQLVVNLTNASVGDMAYWILDSVLQPTGFLITEVYTHQPSPPAYEHRISYLGQVPGTVDAASVRGLFIHKRDAEVARWTTDAANCKLSATTFSYDSKTYQRGALHAQIQLGSITYPMRYQQTFDRTLLAQQVKNAAEQARRDPFFDNVNTNSGTGFIFEQIGDSILQHVPTTAEIVDYQSSSVLDFGNWPLVPTNTPAGQVTSQPLSTYGNGLMLTERLPHPFLTIRGYIGQDTIMNFVKNNPYDRPWLHFLPGTFNGSTLFTFRAPSEQGAYYPVSPLCLGIVQEVSDNRDAFLIWTSSVVIDSVVPIDEANAMSQLTRSNAKVTVAYSSLSLSYNLGRKEISGSSAIVAGSEIRMYSHDGDYIASTLTAQVEHIFPFRQIVLTSADLQQIPERSQDASARQPILTSYTLTTIIPTSIDSQGEPSGGSSNPFGTIYFSETGARRFHHLSKTPGPLRQFKIEVAITRKDSSKPETRVQLAPGGHFTCQLIFMKQMEQE